MAEERIESNDNFVFKEGQNPNVKMASIPGPPPLYNTSSPKISFDDLINNMPLGKTGVGVSPILASELPSSSRYKFYYPGRDPEEMLAQQQGALEKWASGLAKMAGTATTSFLSGTVGTVYGIREMVNTQKFSSLYDNDVNRALDSVNVAMEDYLPNFYTAAEKDAAWYSGGNILTANFWSDKVIKNLGYSIGSLGAGIAWGGILGAMGITNRLVAAGKGMETAAAVESAIATASPIQRFGALRNTLSGLSNQYLKPAASNILTNADRGLISVMGTMGEAGLESLQNLNNTRDKMIQSYIAKNGIAPTGEDLDEINLYAEKVGNYTWGMNVALLTATNYIQLPKILSSSKTAEKRLMNNVVKENLDTGANIAERVGAKYVAEKTLAERIGGRVGKTLDKYVAKPAGLLFAPIEAFEEGAQYAIQTGTQDYFSRAYDLNQNVTDFWSNLSDTFGNVLGEGVKKTLSEKEGIESILIGGIAGGLQTSFSPFGQSTIRERGLFGDGGFRGRNTQVAIDALNNSKNLTQVLKDAVKYANIGVNSQQLRQQAVANDDTLSEKDYEKDYALSYIMPRVKYGKADSIKEELDLYRQQAVTEQGFQELKSDGVVLENEDRAAFLTRLENISKTTSQVEEMYNMFNDRYSAVTNDKGERVYSDSAIERMVYASAKVFDYDARLENLQLALGAKGVSTSNVNDALKNSEGWEEGDFEKVLNNDDVVNAISEVAESVFKSENIDSDETIKSFADYIKLILNRKSYIDEFNDIKNSPLNYQEPVPLDLATAQMKDKEEAPADEDKPKIKLKTQDGEEEIEVGTEYFLGKVVKKSATGKDVFFAPKFTILGENEDGTLQIQDNKGVRSVSKEEFADYKLGKVADTLGNKKAKFFLEHWNTVYEHFGLKDKDGKPKRGRLEYSPKDGVLNFVFLNGKGERRSIEVTGDMLRPKKGYVHGLLKEVGELTAAQTQAKEQFAKEEESVEEVQRPNRLRILGEMYAELSDRKEKTDNLIDQKSKEVTKIKDELAQLEKQIQDAKTDERVKKTVRFKSVTKKALSNAMRLSRMQEQLEKEIEALETDREDIDINLMYVSDLLDNIKALPKTEKKFMQELENHVLDLELLQESTGKQINMVSKLLDQTTSALDAAIEFINNLITKFENKYPDVPRVMGQDYVDFLKANPNFLKLKPNYREDLAQIEDQIAFIDEGEVIPSESRVKELKDHFEVLEGSLSDIQKELSAYQNILDRFEEAHKKYKAQQAKQKSLQQNKAVVKQLVGTMDSYVQNIVDEPESKKQYEPSAKKSDIDVATGTIVSSDENQENKPYNIRANNFGFKFPSLPNRESLRGIIVTSATEDQIIPGLTAHLVKGSNADASTVIAMVVVNENPDGTYYLVNENGEAIPDGADLLNTAIYQVYPLSETLNSMFRANTPEDVKKAIVEEHSAWRNEQLSQTVLGMPQQIESSFGVPQYVEIPTDKTDENGKTVMERDTSARVPAEAAGLITPTMLRNSQVVTVGTNDESISNGSVTFSNPLGRVFLTIPGGMAKLFNRKFNEKEANTIFDVVQQLAMNIQEDGTLTDRSKRLINWLKSVTYWGIAKDPQTKERKPAGYNNIWFEDVLEDNKPVSKLFISGRGTGFNFDVESLDENRELIVNMLQEMYHNTNATMVNTDAYANPYFEITGIDESGEPIVKRWDNYQTYLLSSEGRTANEVPLTTQFRPLSGPNDTNRKGIYFKLKSNVDRFTTPKTPEIVEKPQAKAPALPPRAKKAEEPATPVAPKPKERVLDGKTTNEITLGNFGKVEFTLDGKLYNETNGEKGFSVTFDPKVVQAIMTAKNVDENYAKAIIGQSILGAVKPQLDAMALPKVDPIEDFTAEENDEWDNEAFEAPDDKVYRLQLVEKAKQFEDWTKLEAWLKETFPNVPVYRVKNVIKATNGRQAWGLFQEGAIYLSETAEVGTAYHEVFHAVWRMFSDSVERKAIIDEFKSRSGSFTDELTGDTVKYSEATTRQAEEKLAEEFRDFQLFGTKPSSPKGFIAQLFSDIVNFIKEFFTGKAAASNTEKLFNRIGTGYYARYNPYETSLAVGQSGIIDIDDVYASQGAQYRLTPIDIDAVVKKIPAKQLHDLMQHMTYKTLSEIVKDGKSLFQLPNKTQLYNILRADVLNTLRWQGQQYEEDSNLSKERAAEIVGGLKTLHKSIKEEWESIIRKHEEQLASYSITFSEDDVMILEDENRSGKEDWVDARKIDVFKKTSAGVRLLTSSVPYVTVTANETKFKRTDDGFISLVPTDVIFGALMNELQDSTSLDKMLEKLRAMAIGNPNYRSIYERLTGRSATDPGIELTKTKRHDLRLLAAFWNTFKKQNPNVISVFVLSSGDVVVGDGSLASASKQAKRDMLNSVVAAVKSNKNYFKYDETEKTYNATAKLQGVKLNRSNLKGYVDFLDQLNIEFKESDLLKLTDNQRGMFLESTEFLLKSLAKLEGIESATARALNVEGRLLGLGTVKAIIENPQFESTYFNLNGERVQSSIGVNAMSNLHDVLSKITNINQLTETPYAYLLTDVFSKGSEVLNKMFDVEGDGSRRENTEDILKTSYTDGTLNEKTGKIKESSNYSIKDRIVQELNINFDGVYSNLIPGDAAIAWSQRMYNKKSPFVTEDELMNNDYFRVLRNHFISEVNLARDNRPALRDADKLRFFRSILGKQLADEITSRKNISTSPEELFDGTEYGSRIKSAITQYVNENAKETEELLKQYGVIEYTNEGLQAPELQIEEEVTEEVIKRKLKLHAINYMISNMELHKLLYADPYQYKDELKRIKSFASPRQALVALSKKFNSASQESYNEGYSEGDIGRTDFTRDFFRAATLSDTFSTDEVSPEYADPYEETDGGGYITAKAARNFRIRIGQWTDRNELQYRYDMAFEKLMKGIAINDSEKIFLGKDGNLDPKKNPNDKSTYTSIKPIVSGAKLNDRGYNDIVLDKFALVPLSYRILHELNPNSNAIKLYNKMQAEDVDYAVYASGRKVGAEKTTDLYNEDGSFNESPFQTEQEKNNLSLPQGVLNIPFHIMGLQSEVPSKEESKVTQGTQVTEMVTMDFMQAGVPIDFKPEIENFGERLKAWDALKDKESYNNGDNLYKEIKKNKTLLEERVKNGLDNLMTKLGIIRTKDGFEIENPDDLVAELYSEVVKSGVNDNILYALNGLKLGKVVLEATPAYQYIRNLLFAIADREIKSPRVNGGFKVQIPSTLLESLRVKAKTINGKKAYTSDNLKFYQNEDGKRVCEIMVARWFKSDKTDAELLKYFNETEEGQKILSGVAFRIPTQKQNSIDAFVIKQFLPEAFSDNVVIPSALVKKVGSDFDIDKLSIYLKNVYIDGRGDVKYVPFFGFGETAKAKFADMFDRGEFLTKEQTKELDRYVAEEMEREIDLDSPEAKLIRDIFPEAFTEEAYVKEFVNSVKNAGLKNTIVDKMYTKSLENAYFESMQKLITHPLNFERLIKPNSAKQLQDLSDKIVEKLGGTKTDYANAGNMLNFKFMTALRQAFVSGKYAIGIAAVAQKNHAQTQRTPFTIDPSIVEYLVSSGEEPALGDGVVRFEKFNRIGGRAALSFIKDANNKDYISDTIGQFIDGYVDISKGPWIMDLGATPNVAGTWLFLIKLGVPINTVAFFMNQPIIRDYLRELDSSEYSYLFNDGVIKSMLNKYETTLEINLEQIPSEEELFENIGKDKSDMTDLEIAKQKEILGEFLKYAKMAEQLLVVTQATNFDTATINDPYLITKKMIQLDKARNTIFDSVDKLLDASFVGTLKDTMVDVRDLFSLILISDRDTKDPNKVSVRRVMEAVLRPYANLRDREFVKVSQRAVNDMFDWAVQTNRGINSFVSNILLGDATEESAAKQIIEFKKKVENDPSHPLHNNYVLNSLRIEEGSKTGKPNNLYLVNKTGKSYDQNLIIYGFRQLKEGMAAENKDLYGKLVRLAVIQSGLSNSPISFTSLLPYEDFETVYNETLSNLENLTNLEEYYKLGVLQRNNASNSDIVPFIRFKLTESKKKKGKWFNLNTDFVNSRLTKAMAAGEIPKVINVSPFSREGRSDYVVYSWELPISKAERARRKKTGNRSHVKKGLFKKVYATNESGKVVPLVQVSYQNGIKYEKFVYKMINAWGDSYRANEFYDYARPSQLDNDFEKVYKLNDDKKPISAEVEDIEIANRLNPPKTAAQLTMAMRSDNIVKILSGQKTTTLRTEDFPSGIYKFGGKDFQVTNRGLLSVEEAGGAEAIIKSEAFAETGPKFSSTKEFLEGNRKLYVYDITPAETTNKNAPEGKPAINRTPKTCQ